MPKDLNRASTPHPNNKFHHQQQQHSYQQQRQYHDGVVGSTSCDHQLISTCSGDGLMMNMEKSKENRLESVEALPSERVVSNIVGSMTMLDENSNNETNSSTTATAVVPLSISNSSQSRTNHDGEFKPTLSCVGCRKLHRKCDKKQPKCTECVTYGRECKYTPGKNKQYIRKNKKDKDHHSDKIEDNLKYLMIWNQNMEPQTQWAHTFVKNSVKKQTVDIYYRKLSMGMSTIQQTRMEDLFFRNGTEELDDNEYSLSLFYSIQALCDQ